MSLLDNMTMHRKAMIIFFLVDTSDKMIGSKIGEVNSAIEEVIPELKDLSESNPDVQIKIAVLEFSTGARWLTPKAPISAENFVWNDLVAGGEVHLGDAFRALNEKFLDSSYIGNVQNYFAPMICLLLNDIPSDLYKNQLMLLKQNIWFQKAIKVAIAIGDNADKEALLAFTGNKEAILEVHAPTMLRRMIKYIDLKDYIAVYSNAESIMAEYYEMHEVTWISESQNKLRKIGRIGNFIFLLSTKTNNGIGLIFSYRPIYSENDLEKISVIWSEDASSFAVCFDGKLMDCFLDDSTESALLDLIKRKSPRQIYSEELPPGADWNDDDDAIW